MISLFVLVFASGCIGQEEDTGPGYKDDIIVIDEVNIQSEVFQGDSVPLRLSFENRGRGQVENVEASIVDSCVLDQVSANCGSGTDNEGTCSWNTINEFGGDSVIWNFDVPQGLGSNEIKCNIETKVSFDHQSQNIYPIVVNSEETFFDESESTSIQAEEQNIVSPIHPVFEVKGQTPIPTNRRFSISLGFERVARPNGNVVDKTIDKKSLTVRIPNSFTVETGENSVCNNFFDVSTQGEYHILKPKNDIILNDDGETDSSLFCTLVSPASQISPERSYGINIDYDFRYEYKDNNEVIVKPLVDVS